MRNVTYVGPVNIKLMYNDKTFKPKRGEKYTLTPEMEEVTMTFPGYFEKEKKKEKQTKKRKTTKKKKNGGKKS